MLFCVTQNNNSSLGNTHLVRSVGFSQLTAWLAAQWCGLVVMCSVQHIVINHMESQISQERRAALPSPFTGGWLHMCSLKNALLTHILSTLFSSTSVFFSCTPFGTKSYIWCWFQNYFIHKVHLVLISVWWMHDVQRFLWQQLWPTCM